VKAYDVIVIGSGQGGSPFANKQAKAGKRVALFEKHALGGTCVNTGCTPSKAFLASAHRAGRARLGAKLHVHADVRVDFPAVMERVRGLVGEWRGGVEKHLAESAVDVVMHEASFADSTTVIANGEAYTAPVIVIDTGGRPSVPPIDGLAGTPYFTSDNFFTQTSLPKRLAVIGGGYIGLELGQGMARCGAAVHIIETAPRLLAREEAEVSAVLEAALIADGMTIRHDAKIARVAHDGMVFTITFDDGTTHQSEALLVATGRTPNVPHGATFDVQSNGTIKIDDRFATSVPGIYAIGDVAGQPQFTHVSWEDFRRLDGILSGESRTRNDRVLAYAVFTDPQVGRVGMTLADAIAAGHDAQAVTLQLEDVARAIEWAETDGFYRIVVDRKTEKMLGATLVGYETGELVHVILAHMEAGSTWRTLERSVHIHPTYAEGLPTLVRQLV